MNFAEIIKEYRDRELLTQEQLADILGVAFVSVNRWENGHFEPTPKVKKHLLELYYGNKIPTPNLEDIGIKTCEINNRRYLGNKYKLLNFIRTVVNENCPNIESFADIFAGTGSVSSAFNDYKVITNDILYSNYLSNVAWFSSQSFRKDLVINLLKYFNSIEVNEVNYMSENFSNTYFSANDCSKIGYIRQFIEDKYNNKEINERERAILVSSLIYAMDHIANTCGHYDAYIKHSDFSKSLELCYPNVPENNNKNNMCFNMDANELVKNLNVDLVYIDPPYNSRQYCDTYHLLENVARWNKPEVYGVAKKMNRDNLKSDYCTKKAKSAFQDLINNISSKYILVSYNNMGTKGNDRSNAKISDEDIIEILNKKGKVTVFSQNYRAFSTGKSKIEDNQERLFLCKCKGVNND